MRDAMGNQSFQTYERHGKIGTQIDAEGGLQYSSYNQFGERVKLTQKVTGGVDLVTDYSYDMLGRVETTSVANVRTYALDDTMAGNGMNVVGDGTLQTLTTRYVYDQLGRRVAIVDSARGESRTRYDLDGNVVATGDQTGIGLTYSYDAFHHKILEVDGMGMTLSWRYDDEAKLVRYTDMSNAVVLYGYDGLGRKTTQTSSARGTDGLQQNLLFSYDKAGLLARIEDRTSRQVTTYEYDLAGNRVHEKTVIVETKPATAAVILPTDPDAATITELYEVLLGRHPDPAGLEYWRGRYNGIRGGLYGSINTVAKLAEIMLTSDEARETFKSDGSVEQFVDKLFSVAVGRQPSATQRASYISQFDNGYDRRGRVVMQFLSDLRPAEREVLNAKIDAALHPVARPAQDVDTVVQDNRIEFDDLGRMRVVEDMHSHVEFYYDANGNRLEVRSSYRTAASGYIGVEGDLVENDVFNTYDKANRQLFVNAVKVNGALEIGKYGHKLSYDSAGQRISDTYRRKAEDAATVVTDNYGYDNAGRMTTTTRDGWVIDLRQYDIGGRLIRSGITVQGIGLFDRDDYKGRLEGWDIATNHRNFAYDAAGRILRQKDRDFDGKQLNDIKYVNDGFRTTPMGYDNAGRLRGYFLIPAHSELVEQYNYSIKYSFMDSAQQSSITVKRDNTVRTTTNAYDQNGNLIRVTAPRMDTEVEINRVYVNDASGHVLRMTAGSEVTSSLVVNDQLFASYGGAGADAEHGIFANTFTSATDVLAGGTSQSVYVVQSASETLQIIAKMVWGDSSLWYLIADANGLSTETLTVGMPLQIPTRVSAVRNDYASFKPYDRSSIDGGITPSLPAPAGKGGCGPVGTIVVIVVACILNAFMPGAGTVLGQIFIGAVSSAVGQMAAIEAGEQDRFSWKAVALSAASAGMAQGVSDAMVGHELFDSAVANKAFNAAVANAMTQGVGVAMHWQEHFQWRGVAAAAASAGASQAVGEALQDTAFGNRFGANGVGPVAAFAGGAAGAIARGGRIRFGQALADAFGNVLAQSFASSIANDRRDAEAARLSADQMRAGREDAEAANWAWEKNNRVGTVPLQGEPSTSASYALNFGDQPPPGVADPNSMGSGIADYLDNQLRYRPANANRGVVSDQIQVPLPISGDASILSKSYGWNLSETFEDGTRIFENRDSSDIQRFKAVREFQSEIWPSIDGYSLNHVDVVSGDAIQTQWNGYYSASEEASIKAINSTLEGGDSKSLKEFNSFADKSSNASPTTPNYIAMSGVGVFTGAVSSTNSMYTMVPGQGAYGRLSRSMRGTDYQAHHLNQDAAYKMAIRPSRGESIALRGDALHQEGSAHFEAHKSLEVFWEQYRTRGGIDGPLAGTRPTNAQYGAALEKSLRDAGISPENARKYAEAAKAQRVNAGLSEAAQVPKLPGRINQSVTQTVDAELWRMRRYSTNLSRVGKGVMVVGAALDAHSLYKQAQISKQTGNYGNTVKEAGRIAGGWSAAWGVGTAFGTFGAEFGLAVGGPVGAVVGGFAGGLIGGGVGYYFGGNAVEGIISDFR